MANFQMSDVAEPALYNASNRQGANNAPFGGPRSVVPPVLPPRPYQTQSYGAWNNGNTLGNGFRNYDYSGYNGIYNTYGSYDTYNRNLGYDRMYGSYNRMGFNPMYGQHNMENRFIQYAEETSRPAFQTIESVVNAFGGIAQMLDATYMAFTTSFRAVLRVADNFGHMRSLFAQFWSTLAIFRTINWMYRKLLSLLGLSKHDPQKIKAWANAMQDIQQDENKNISTWPIFIFLSIITSASFIMYKLFGRLNQSVLMKTMDPSTWDKPLLASAIYDFSSSNSNELSLRTMQSVKVAPLEIQNKMNLINTGWLLASTDNNQAGLVPANYIQIIKGNINANTTNQTLDPK